MIKGSFFRFAMEVMFGRDPRKKREAFKSRPFNAFMKLMIVLVAMSAPKFYSSYHTYYTAYNDVLKNYRREKIKTEKLEAEVHSLRSDVSVLTQALVKINNSNGNTTVQAVAPPPKQDITKKTIRHIPVDKPDIKHKPEVRKEKPTEHYDRKTFLLEGLEKGHSNESNQTTGSTTVPNDGSL